MSMKLIDLLEITSEHTTVHIIDYDTHETISLYDGKNSISSTLNEKRVALQFVKYGELYINVVL